MNLGTTAARGISTTASPMTDRAARGTAIAAGIKNTTSSSQASTLLLRMRDAMQTRLNDGTRNDTTLVRLVHTTKTDQEMAFETLDKKWGNKTRTLETKAALIAEFEQAGWDATELHEYLDTITTRQDRILESRICTILDNAAKKAQADGPNLQVDTTQVTTPWDSDSIIHAPKLGEGGQGSAYQLQINNEPVVVKVFDPLKLPPPVQLDPQHPSPHIKRDAEVTAAFIKGDASSVVKPSLFIARVTDSNKTQTEHLVKGGKDFKEWAKDQLWDKEANRPRQNPPTIQLTGLVMPHAAGKTLDHTVLKTNLPFTKTAESALNALNQMANHGFVHGDIKPSNLVVKQDGDLALIDTGSMAKITKRAPGAMFEIADAYFDKASRPYTSDHTHPGHPPDFNKVGMEQDLFSMGVTLLETKIASIAKNLARDDAQEAQEFIDAAQSIRDTIVDQNKSPNAFSAQEIREEIKTQLDDLKSNYPAAFADGEVDCAVGFIDTALAQKKPVLDREQWKEVLADLRGTIPASSGDRQELLKSLQARNLPDARGAMAHFTALKNCAQRLTQEESNAINRDFLGGGNVLFKAVYDNPALLEQNLSAEDRKAALLTSYEPVEKALRMENLAKIDQQIEGLLEQGALDNDSAAGLRKTLAEGAENALLAIRTEAAGVLGDPEKIAPLVKLHNAATEIGLSSADAMSVVRIHQNVQRLSEREISSSLNALYSNQPVTVTNLGDIAFLFPPVST